MRKVQIYALPPRLFRYRRPEHLDRELKAIEESYVYCSCFDKLNDPMEGLFSYSALIKGSYLRTAKLGMDIKHSIESQGICSFSEVNDHELMWAHYADQFRGFCIEYSFSKLCKHLPDDVEFVRMFYNEKAPTVGKTTKTPDKIAKRILSYKNHRWLYEREWRMFGHLGENSYNVLNCVTKVHIGARMDKKKSEELIRRLEKVGVPTRKMSIDGYRIGF